MEIRAARVVLVVKGLRPVAVGPTNKKNRRLRRLVVWMTTIPILNPLHRRHPQFGPRMENIPSKMAIKMEVLLTLL